MDCKARRRGDFISADSEQKDDGLWTVKQNIFKQNYFQTVEQKESAIQQFGSYREM